MQKPTNPVKRSSSIRNIMGYPIIKGGSHSLPRQKTIHSGWLWKKGVMNSQLSNRRWFEIKGDQLYYFKAKGDSNPLGQVSLAGNEIKRHPPLADTSGKYLFEIIAGEQRKGRPVMENFDTLLFGAEAPYEMEEWIKAINRVIYTPLGGGMFGRSIIETVKLDSRKGGGMVPIIVEQCVEYIRKIGMNEEGIFRVPGAKDDVEMLKNSFNKGETITLKEGEYKVHIVASVLKQYIGDLPDPVIPSENYDQFIAVGGLYKEDNKAAISKFRNLLKIIPKEHLNLLKYLSRFLFELQTYEKTTKMTIVNLALVFGPNILRPQGDDPDFLLKSLGDVNRTTMAIVMCQEELFPVTPDEKYYQPRDSFDNLYLKVAPPMTQDKRSMSDSSLSDLIDLERTFSTEKRDEVAQLKKEIEEQRKQFQDQIEELENKLDAEIKIREMIKIRLTDEHKARVAAEERLELYRNGIEEYCKKFGHVDISIS
ncbi:rho GTPase-activating protein 24-like [Hydractinia symbiolongicarpus]|uniref:rho GTPase-activating protein 24-like n=1 Tax=Hydractinia symbiolongicarpus TaxID=13093 RepID=UPI00254AA30E|nr:rho GTPase-activating protein 24-like [Hydractinia symbiolongicarpus]